MTIPAHASAGVSRRQQASAGVSRPQQASAGLSRSQQTSADLSRPAATCRALGGQGTPGSAPRRLRSCAKFAVVREPRQTLRMGANGRRGARAQRTLRTSMNPSGPPHPLRSLSIPPPDPEARARSPPGSSSDNSAGTGSPPFNSQAFQSLIIIIFQPYRTSYPRASNSVCEPV